MESKIWNETVKNNFNNAAANYIVYSNIQRYFRKDCFSLKGLNIQNGESIDLAQD